MLKILIILITPLVVFVLSSNAVKHDTKSEKSEAKQHTTESPTIQAPDATTQLGLFLGDEDFDIVDLINADRRNK